jgi:hypothetical protein
MDLWRKASDIGTTTAGIAEPRSLNMIEKLEAEMISRRRAFWILGVGAALGVGMPAAMLTASDAEAQTVGMERRQAR